MEYKYTLVSGGPDTEPTREGFNTRSEAAEAWVKAKDVDPERTHKIEELTVSDVMGLVDRVVSARLVYEAAYAWDLSKDTEENLKHRDKMRETREELRSTIEGLLK